MLVEKLEVVESAPRAEGWFARVSWQAKLGIVAVAFLLVVAFMFYSKLQHLPGPYYGGDLYAHHGFALNYVANGFWSDPYFINEYSFYPWLGNYLFIVLSFLPGLSLMQAENFVGLITQVLSAIAFWMLGWQLFKNRTWALLLMLLSLFTRGFPSGAPNLLPWMVTIPFWFAFWLKAEESGKMRDKVIAGVFMGATALSHVAFFLSGMAVYAFTVLVEMFRQHDKKKALIHALKLYGPMLLAGAAVALLFYGPIIVKYQAHSVNPLFEYNGPNIDTLGIGWWIKTIIRVFFNFSTLPLGILTVLTVIGMAVCAMNLHSKAPRYALLWFIAGALTPMHHLITRPLLGSWVLPGHLWGMALPMLVFAVYGVRAVMQFADKKFPDADAQKIVLLLFLILCGAFFVNYYNEWKNDRWVQFGEKMDATTQAMLAMGDWIRNNTEQNAVFLAHDEPCFAMNGVSGRKCVFVRRTHANYFVDVEQRYADGMVMLYGNNSTLTKRLLNEYEVDYLLLDSMMMQSPMLIEPRFERYLMDNNVSFARVTERKDPADPNAKTFEMLAVPLQPLNRELESRIDEAARFSLGAQPYLRVFNVRR
jgi:hypothetical protein